MCVTNVSHTPSSKHNHSLFQGEMSRLFHPYHGDLTAKHAGEVTTAAVTSRVAGRLKQ